MGDDWIVYCPTDLAATLKQLDEEIKAQYIFILMVIEFSQCAG